MLARRDVRLLLSGAVIGLCWLAGRELAGLESGLLYLVPVLVLMLPLLVQRYPGEREIRALASRLRRPRRLRTRAARALRCLLVFIGPGVGDVLAFELAGRAPPLLH